MIFFRFLPASVRGLRLLPLQGSATHEKDSKNMAAGSVERGMGDSSPPRAPASTEADEGSTPVAQESIQAVLTRQATAAGEVTPDEAAAAAALLHTEISQELLENRSRLRGFIYGQGYREPDLSVLDNETQARCCQARIKPDFALRYGEPWPCSSPVTAGRAPTSTDGRRSTPSRSGNCRPRRRWPVCGGTGDAARGHQRVPRAAPAPTPATARAG